MEAPMTNPCTEIITDNTWMTLALIGYGYHKDHLSKLDFVEIRTLLFEVFAHRKLPDGSTIGAVTDSHP